MELPTDIIDYLSPYLWKTIKPKRYTLLNKRCRDFYYTKNGVYLDLSLDHEIPLLCYKYDIHINIAVDPKIDYISEIIYRLGEFCPCVVSVKIKNCINPNQYIIMTKSFPRLKKFKCLIQSLPWLRLSVPLISGTLIRFNKCYMEDMIKYADLGYKFYIDNYFVGEEIDMPDKIKQSVVKLKTYSIDIVSHFPNLRILKHISINRVKKQESFGCLVEHPNITKISTKSIIGPLPKNGIRIKYKCYSKNIESLTEYDSVKKYYDRIYVSCDYQIDELISYEKETTMTKKMYIEINMTSLNSYEDIDKLLGHFHVILRVCYSDKLINHYINSTYDFKIKSIRPTKLFRFATDNGKLYMYISQRK